jgi:hypothetical protein
MSERPEAASFPGGSPRALEDLAAAGTPMPVIGAGAP